MKRACELLRKLNRLLTKQQKTLGLLVLASSILAAIMELLGVSVIVPLINALVNPNGLYNNAILGGFLSSYNIEIGTTEYGRNKLVVIVFSGVITIYLLKNIFFVFNTWLKNKYAFKVQREISVTMMRKYINNGYSFFLNHNYSELRQGIDGDVRALYYIISGILQIFTQTLIVGLIGIYMLLEDIELAIGAILTGLFCVFFVLGIFRRKMTENGKKSRELAIKAEKTMEETLHGIKLVLLSHKEHFFIEKFNREIVMRNRIDSAITTGSEIPMYIIEAISISGIMVSLCVRILSMGNPELYVAVLGSFAVGVFRILPAIGKISSSVNGIISSAPGLNSIYQNIIIEKNDSLIESSERLCDIEMDFSNKIEVKSVSFKYSGSNRIILNNVSFTIKRGESIGIIGESGAGKSTLADILLGLLAPSSGEVLVDNINISYLYKGRWKGIGYVPQTIFLTDSTIAENVAYGVLNGDIDRNKVESALDRANVFDFIKSLPLGIDTVVGDRGVRLSGGQRQRIGIARALYTTPDIIILDEATSALDNETEKAVMDAIEKLQGTITMVIIAHRLSTIRKCDRVLEIKNGHIKERKVEDL